MTKTLYFKDAAGHMSDGVEVTVKFDLTPPAGEIAVGEKWWQKFLNFVSFGHYAAKEYTVTIKAEDAGGSGIEKIDYAIVTGESQYTKADALEAAVTAGEVSWTPYADSSRPTVPVDTSQYVVYARLTDKAGNVTYISTDGILLDDTPPVVDGLSVPGDAPLPGTWQEGAAPSRLWTGKGRSHLKSVTAPLQGTARRKKAMQAEPSATKMRQALSYTGISSWRTTLQWAHPPVISCSSTIQGLPSCWMRALRVIPPLCSAGSRTW